MRIGVVLDPRGGALAKLLPVFRAGMGGPVAGGEQLMSWVALDVDDAGGGRLAIVAVDHVVAAAGRIVVLRAADLRHERGGAGAVVASSPTRERRTLPTEQVRHPRGGVRPPRGAALAGAR